MTQPTRTEIQSEAAWVVIEMLKTLPARLAARVQSDMKNIAKAYHTNICSAIEFNYAMLERQAAAREEDKMRKRRPEPVVHTSADEYLNMRQAEDDEDYLPPEDDNGTAPVMFFTKSGELPVVLEPLATGQSVKDRTFWLLAEKLPQIEQAAKKLGLRLEILENSEEDLVRWMMSEIIEGSSYEEKMKLRASVDKDAIRQMARRFAPKMAQVRVHYPEADYTIIATAEMLSPDKTPTGLPMAKLSQAQSYWSDERIRALDFQRCDECGVRSHRKYIYIVAKRHADNYVQLGGSCASQLDLSQKLKAMIKAVESFAALARQMLVEAGIMEPMGNNGGMRLRAPMNISVYVKLTDFFCSKLGFVSSKKSHEAADRGQLLPSTVDRIKALLYKSHEPNSPASATKAAILSAYSNPEGEAYIANLIQAAQAKADSLDADKAVSEFRHTAQMAIYGGFGPGVLVWLISSVRDGGQESLQSIFGKAQSWGTVTHMRSYEDNFGIGYSDLVPIAERGGWADVPDMIHTLMDVTDDDGSVTSTTAADAEIARMGKLDKRNVPINRSSALEKALQRSLQGLWWIANRFEKYDQTYGGMSYSANLVRLDDYAIIYITGKGLANVKQGEVVRVLSAARRNLSKGWFNNYLKVRIPDSMHLDRATLQVVDGVLPFTSESVFTPRLAPADWKLETRLATLTMGM
jgi:hypothetical protein